MYCFKKIEWKNKENELWIIYVRTQPTSSSNQKEKSDPAWFDDNINTFLSPSNIYVNMYICMYYF